MPESPEAQSPTTQTKPSGFAQRLAIFLGVWIALAGLAAGFQYSGGAYGADFGSHPDEASHFVTGLMVRDYLGAGIPGHPMRYAENYYSHYPKVAIGHYPPGFYLVEGLWLLVFPVATWSVLAFMAIQSGLLGALVFSLLVSRVGRAVAAGAGALAVALPLTQILAATVMSDLLLSLACLLATLAFSRFLTGGSWKDSLAFGVLAAFAALVKGSGLFLALFVPLTILFSRRWDLLKRPALWLGALPVVLIAGPWYFFTTAITSEGMIEKDWVDHLAEVIPYFAQQGLRWLGWTLCGLALFGVVSSLHRREFRADVTAVCFLAFTVSLIVFYALTPAGLDPRYLMPLVAPALFLAGLGIREVARWAKRSPGWVPGVALLGLAALEVIRTEVKESSGWAEIAEIIAESPSDQPPKILVVSDPRGEGGFIAEMAIQDSDRPSFSVHRGSKVLSTSDWLGRNYEPMFATSAELDAFLVEQKFDWVVVDESVPERTLRPYHDQIRDLLLGGHESELVPEFTQLIKRQRGDMGIASVFRKSK